MERTKERLSFRKKFIGDRRFYMMVLAVAVPIMIQNGITNFVSLLDNIMIGRIGTEQMSGASIVNQLIFVYNLCIFGGVSGAGIFTAQYFGQKDNEGVRQTFRYKLWMAVILTIGTTFCSDGWRESDQYVSAGRGYCAADCRYAELWKTVSGYYAVGITAVYDGADLFQYSARVRRDGSSNESRSCGNLCEPVI